MTAQKCGESVLWMVVYGSICSSQTMHDRPLLLDWDEEQVKLTRGVSERVWLTEELEELISVKQ